MELILKKIDEINKFMRVDINRISIPLLITFLYFHFTFAYELYNILFSEFETFELFGYKLLYICYCSIPFLMILYSIIF
ncbi:MAG: hypothetical protein PWP53_324 [Lacrimispora sp.]|nr:hypothetical protein [Lacrimispora sp.]